MNIIKTIEYNQYIIINGLKIFLLSVYECVFFDRGGYYKVKQMKIYYFS
jgi:hypothetical protein